jgi:hypothetical protein
MLDYWRIQLLGAHLKWEFKMFWSKFDDILKFCMKKDTFTSKSLNMILSTNKLDTIFSSLSNSSRFKKPLLCEEQGPRVGPEVLSGS